MSTFTFTSILFHTLVATMRLHPTPAVAASLLLSLPSSSEAKLGAPRRSPLHDEQHNQQPHQKRLLPQNIATDPHPAPSCHEHPGQFRYSTRTNGEVLVSCSSLVVQLARGAVSSSKITNKCRQSLVGLEDWYGPDATVADACPGLCGRPCDGQDAPIIEEDSPDIADMDQHDEEYSSDIDVEQEQHEKDSNDIDVDQPDIDEPMMDLIEPTPIDDVMEPIEVKPAEEQPTSVVESTTSIIETIQTQVEQELTESEDEEYGDMTPTIDLIAASEDEEEDEEEEYEKPTPTIASFGKFIYCLF